MKTYILISFGILGIWLFERVLSKFLRRNIEHIVAQTSESISDKVRSHIRMCMYAFIPFFRWVLVWATFKSLTSTDAEMVELANKMHEKVDDPVRFKVKEREKLNERN